MKKNYYKCKHCKGISDIKIIQETEKATEPKIEFCPFCGMPNQYSKEKGGDEE